MTKKVRVVREMTRKWGGKERGEKDKLL
jgi:hypothetical protein